jgi:hypothetical protein
MVKRLLIILALFLPSLAGAQLFPHQNWCEIGGKPSQTQGLTSTNNLQGSYPGCLVEVFVTGTGTHATLFSDSSGLLPLSDPFTADLVTGYYSLYTSAGCYDAVTSGAGITSPHTETFCLAASSTSGTVTSVTQTNNASSLFTVGIASPTSTPQFTFGLTQFGAHKVWGNGTGSTATPLAFSLGTADLPFTYSGSTLKLMTSATISGSPGTPLCLDGLLNATTSGCSVGSGDIKSLPGAAAQTIVQGSAGGNVAGTNLNVNSFENVRYADQFNWSQSPSGTIAGGPNTVTINAVRGISSWSAPPGNGGFSMRQHIWIAGTGTPEDVLLTGTTCIGASTGTCTVTFSAAGTHAAGFTLASATGGWQEAWIDGMVTPSAYAGPNPQNGMIVMGSPGQGSSNFTFNAPLEINYPPGAPGPLILDGHGSTITCNTSGKNCIAVNEPAVSFNRAEGIQIRNFLLTPKVGMGRTADGTTKAIYDAGQGTVIANNSFPWAATNDVFDYVIYIDNDQKVTISDNFANTGVGPAMKCDSTWCGSFIYGSALNSGAFGTISGNDLSMNCTGNALDWHSGNGVTIANNVFQSWSQWPWRYGGSVFQDINDAGGNYYEGSAACVNPDFGVAGYSVNAGPQYMGLTRLLIPNNEFGGVNIHRFSNTGATTYAYYIQGVKTAQQSAPLYIGYASTDGVTNFNILYLPFGADTYNVLRSGPLLADGTDAAPNGTGNWLVATGVVCASAPCTFTETFAAPSSITINPLYVPTTTLNYWPVPLLLHRNVVGQSVIYEGPGATQGGFQAIVSTALLSSGAYYQAIFTSGATQAANGNVAPTGLRAMYLATSNGASSGQTAGAMMMPLGQLSANLIGKKGRINFSGALGGSAARSFSLQTYDANPTKTQSTYGHQPSYDSLDCGIGYDTAPSYLAFSCGNPISFWVGAGNPFSGNTKVATFSTTGVAIPGDLTVGGGTTLKKFLSTTATLDFGSLVSIGCEDLTVAVTGAVVGDTVSLGVPSGSVPSSNFYFPTPWVSAADTVTIRGCALVSGDPASGTFRVTVAKF